MSRHSRRAPKRTERVTIQKVKSDAVQTAHGEIDKSNDANWEDVATRWAKVAPKSASEKDIGDQIISFASTEFDFRYDAVTAAINSEDRLKHRGKVYEIDQARNPEMRNDSILVSGIVVE